MYGSKAVIKNNLADQSYWDQSYAAIDLSIAPKDDLIRKFIEHHIPPTKNGTCFEAGTFPGRFLAVFGELGYELNGIDLTPRISEMPGWLKSCGYKTGHFEQKDFFQVTDAVQYDVVVSFGFIEHFRNWREVIAKHAQLVKSGGYLVITTPNFRGWIQNLIHRFLDHENYKRHYIAAMQPEKWKRIVEKRGFEVTACKYIGEFNFWVDKIPSTRAGRKMYYTLMKYRPQIAAKYGISSPTAPYIGMIARKK